MSKLSSFIDHDIAQRTDADRHHLTTLRSGKYSHDCFVDGWHWCIHKHIFDQLDLSNADSDIKILDIGTFFGYIPYILKKYGFNNVSATDQSSVLNSAMHKYHEFFNVTPYELTITPFGDMALPEKYDLILIINSEFFWNRTPIVQWNVDTNTFYPNHSMPLYSQNNETVINMAPWCADEFKFLVDNIKQYLTPTGVAIINPHPYVYTPDINITAITETSQYLNTFKDDSAYMPFTIHCNTDYIVIRNTL
jgi:hypothetical protein